jgi:hypothetical protein
MCLACFAQTIGGNAPVTVSQPELVDRLPEPLRMHVGTEMADDDRTIVAARIR